MAEPTTVYTLGHGDHTVEAFIGLLRQHAITLVVDVRSQPVELGPTDTDPGREGPRRGAARKTRGMS